MKKLNHIKKDFALLSQDPKLVYLDSTATSLKPSEVLHAEREYYEAYSANIYRGIYAISERATARFEESRGVLAAFINARPDEIIFTRNTTEGLNLLAYTLPFPVERGDELVATVMEHHSNFVPWQQLAKKRGATFRVMDVRKEGCLDIITEDGGIDEPKLRQYITPKTRLFTMTYVSNVLGTINPVDVIIAAVRKINPRVFIIVDAAQAIPHMPVDVKKIGCDALAFSGHKMLGPTGIGVLWIKKKHTERLSPFLYGGEMIDRVTVEETTFKPAPFKYEAGTPHIAGVIGLGAAATYLGAIGWDNIIDHERELTSYAVKKLNQTFSRDIRIVGPSRPEKRSGIIAFALKGCHPHDVASILDEEHVAVRAGTHCAMPLHERIGLEATVRASFYIYNTIEDVDQLVAALIRARATLARS